MKKKILSLVLATTLVFSIIFVGQANVSAAEPQKKKLIAHYKFDGDLKDASGAKNDGTAVGNITYVDGKSGKAAKFDGKSYIKVKHNDEFNFKNGFTLSLWIYEDSFDNHRESIITKSGVKDKDQAVPYYLYLLNKKPVFSILETDYRTPLTDKELKPKQWNLVTITYDGKEFKYYIDGALATESKLEVNADTSSGDLLIGCDTYNDTIEFNGLMDDIRIYNYALYDHDVATLYTEATGSKVPYDESTTAYAKAFENDGIVAYYKFNGDLLDGAKKGNDGTAIGNITYVQGVEGTAALFDGSSYIQVADNDTLDLSNGSFTMSAWIYKEEIRPNREQPILNKLGSSIDGAMPSYTISDVDYIPYVKLWDVDENYSNVESAKQIDMQKWTMLTVTYDGNSLKHYYDGVLKSEKQFKASIPASDGNLQIGYNEFDGGSFFKGKIDELKIFNRVLDPQEIKGFYERTLNGTGKYVLNRPTIMAARYMFEDNLKDNFGYGNDGTAVGNITYDAGKFGKAAKFDGSSYIEVKDSDILDVSNGFTFSVWVYKEGQNREYPILNKPGSSTDIDRPSYVFSDRDMYPYVSMFDESTNFTSLESPKTLEANKWTLVTVTFDGKSVKYYYNSVLIGSKEGNINVPNSSGKLQIGINNLDGTSFFKGKMDDLRIYTKALTPDQIQSLWAMYGF